MNGENSENPWAWLVEFVCFVLKGQVSVES